MTLAECMRAEGVSLAGLAKLLKVSKTAAHRIVSHGNYPATLPLKVAMQRLVERFPALDKMPTPTQVIHAVATDEENLMQISDKTLKLFGLQRNPFENDIEADADVFNYHALRDVSEAIRAAIEERSFLTVVGPSGAGKTTIWDGIESEYDPRQLIVCRPRLKNKERMTPDHLVRALLYGLCGESCKIKQDAEDRGRQLSAALRDLYLSNSERKAVLVIDDAHFSSQSVLRQLKTFYEEKVGRYRLLTVILIGLPELTQKLTKFPEIGRRVRMIDVPPVPVEDYLRFKLKRVGLSIDNVFDPSGLAAFLGRFRAPRRAAYAHPLAINWACICAMCKVDALGGRPGDRITAAIVDELPSDHAIQQMAKQERAA